MDWAAAKAPEAEGLHSALDNVQHLLRLREEERLVALLLPVLQHLQAPCSHPSQFDASNCRQIKSLHMEYTAGGNILRISVHSEVSGRRARLPTLRATISLPERTGSP